MYLLPATILNLLLFLAYLRHATILNLLLFLTSLRHATILNLLLFLAYLRHATLLSLLFLTDPEALRLTLDFIPKQINTKDPKTSISNGDLWHLIHQWQWRYNNRHNL